MPSDMEGDDFNPEDEGLPTEGTEGTEAGLGGAEDSGQSKFYTSSLFEDYLAAVANKTTPSVHEQAEVSGDRNDIPHAVPVVIDRYPNEHAGQPIRMLHEVDPQAYMTGCLADDATFELADFIISTGMTSSERDTFFKLQSNQHLPWKNDAQFMEDIKRLPKGPEMRLYTGTVGEGDNAEKVEMWTKDILEVLEHLLGDPRFENHINYTPWKGYTNEECKNRVFSETCTGNWWWRMQCLIEDEFGTVLPVILSSDKTGLTVLSGGKEAWPVYMTIGNISKDVRRQPSKRAVVLLGYLPIPSTLSSEADEGSWGKAAWDLFHKCMSVMVEPLVKATQDGVEMRCLDRGVRRCYPFLASYVVDHPEQCLVACTARCPSCEQTTDGWGELGEPAPLRTKVSTLQALEEAEVGVKVGVNSLGLRVVWPFWANLLFVNLATAMTPDLLHQLHKGMFLDHLVPWCTELMGAEEMDCRFKAMTWYHNTRHFAHGIWGVSQWTGREAKEMARVFLSIIDGAVPTKAVHAAWALINFMFMAHAPSLTSLELKRMDELLATFHANKDIFRKRKNGTLGTPDGYNTKTTKRLHIPLSKEPYRASNKVDPTQQMAKTVELKDAVARRRYYLQKNSCIHLVFRRSRAGEGDENTEGSNNGDEGDSRGEDVNREIPIPRIQARPFEPCPQFDLAKRSTWPLKAGSTIINAHEALDLVSATNEFLDKILPPGHGTLICPRVLEHHLFPCCSQFTLQYAHLPFKPSEPAKSTVMRAAPSSFKDGKQTRPASFDTVLVPFQPNNVGLARYHPAH
ncbi:hypothetical protein FRC06_011677, partial [Ceratobasidium sp. 370]